MIKYKDLFAKYGISQTKASIYLDISKGYFSDILNGRRTATKEEELREYLRKLSSDIVNIL